MTSETSGRQIVQALIEAASTAPADPAARLQALWANPKKFSGHAEKRVERGDVSDVIDYAERTFAVLAEAKLVKVAEPPFAGGLRTTGKIQVAADGWVVLLSQQGGIVTSYPFDPVKPSFEQRHHDLGDSIHDYRLPEDTRRLLAQLFGDG